MSCMINCYLSVVRTIVIVSPFTVIRPWALLGSLGTYTTAIAVLVLVAFLTAEWTPVSEAGVAMNTSAMAGGFCTHMWMVCEPELSVPPEVDSLILTGIPYVLPCLPVFMCCCIIIYKQVTSDQFGKNMKGGTITIVYVSILFIICNSAFLIFSYVRYDEMYNALTDAGGKNANHTDYVDIAWYYGLRTFSTFVNAAGNVLILLLRSSGVKEWSGKVWRREVKLQDLLSPAKARRETQLAQTASSVVGYLQRQSGASTAHPGRKESEAGLLLRHDTADSIKDSKL